VRELKRDSK